MPLFFTKAKISFSKSKQLSYAIILIFSILCLIGLQNILLQKASLNTNSYELSFNPYAPYNRILFDEQANPYFLNSARELIKLQNTDLLMFNLKDNNNVNNNVEAYILDTQQQILQKKDFNNQKNTIAHNVSHAFLVKSNNNIFYFKTLRQDPQGPIGNLFYYDLAGDKSYIIQNNVLINTLVFSPLKNSLAFVKEKENETYFQNNSTASSSSQDLSMNDSKYQLHISILNKKTSEIDLDYFLQPLFINEDGTKLLLANFKPEKFSEDKRSGQIDLYLGKDFHKPQILKEDLTLSYDQDGYFSQNFFVDLTTFNFFTLSQTNLANYEFNSANNKSVGNNNLEKNSIFPEISIDDYKINPNQKLNFVQNLKTPFYTWSLGNTKLNFYVDYFSKIDPSFILEDGSTVHLFKKDLVDTKKIDSNFLANLFNDQAQNIYDFYLAPYKETALVLTENKKQSLYFAYDLTTSRPQYIKFVSNEIDDTPLLEHVQNFNILYDKKNNRYYLLILYKNNLLIIDLVNQNSSVSLNYFLIENVKDYFWQTEDTLILKMNDFHSTLIKQDKYAAISGFDLSAWTKEFQAKEEISNLSSTPNSKYLKIINDEFSRQKVFNITKKIKILDLKAITQTNFKQGHFTYVGK